MHDLALCMIVKNESHCIVETLNTLVDYIDYWVICDTGSSDKTEAVVRKFFSQRNINGEYHHHKWVNFAHNRTLAFEAAFRKSRYVLVFDADDLLHVPASNDNSKDDNSKDDNSKDDSSSSSSSSSCSSKKLFPPDLSQGVDCYRIPIRASGQRYSREFIFRNDIKWRYRGVVHEEASRVGGKPFQRVLFDNGIYVESRRLGNRNRDPNKYLKDATLLVAAINDILKATKAGKQHPDKDLLLRYYFFAGQSYFDHKDYAKSMEYYRGWTLAGSEEMFFSQLRIGNCMEELNYPAADIIASYKAAFATMPDRTESLYALARYYIKINQLQEAFLTLSLANSLPFPSWRQLYITRETYDFSVKYELLQVANYLGYFDISNTVCQQLLASTNVVGDNDSDQIQDNRRRQYQLEAKRIMEANQQQTSLRRRLDFTDYIFYEDFTVDGYNIDQQGRLLFDDGHSKSVASSNDLVNVLKLRKLADGLEDCTAFDTNGNFKNIIFNLSRLRDFPSNNSFANGIYVKRGWKDNSKPVVALYVGNQPIRHLADRRLLINSDSETGNSQLVSHQLMQLAERLKVNYNIFIVDNIQPDNIIIKVDNIFHCNLDYYVKLTAHIKTYAVIICCHDGSNTVDNNSYFDNSKSVINNCKHYLWSQTATAAAVTTDAVTTDAVTTAVVTTDGDDCKDSNQLLTVQDSLVAEAIDNSNDDNGGLVEIIKYKLVQLASSDIDTIYQAWLKLLSDD